MSPRGLLSTTVRPEQPGDVGDIRRIHAEAFAGHPHSRGTEPLIVDALRTRGKLALSLVACDSAGRLVGHIAFSPVLVGGLTCGWFGLGPLGVLPGEQGRGVGTALVESGLALLGDSGARGCVVLGDPRYYGRFGFAPTSALRLPGVPPSHFMAILCARDGGVRGEVVYDSAFAAES